MKLYYSKGACSLGIRIIIHEIGLSCEYEAVDLRTKKTETGKDFLQINRKGAVPALLTNDGELLTENLAIHLYLVETNQAQQLLPVLGNFKRYRVLEWLNYVSTDVHKSFAPLFNPTIPAESKEKIFVPLIKTKLTYIDQQLEQKDYLVGNDFTLPDAYLYVVLTWTFLVKINLTEWPNVTRYFKQIQTRKSVQQALQEENLVYSLA